MTKTLRGRKHEVVLHPGDVVLTVSGSFLSRAIRRFTRGLREPRTRFSHCELVVISGTLESADVVSADGHGITLRKIYPKHTGHQVAVYRLHWTKNPELNLKIGWNIASRIRTKLGAPYPIWRLFMHLLDWFLLDAFVFRRAGRSSKTMECSSLVAWAVEPYVKFRDRPWYLISPDDIDDSIQGWLKAGKARLLYDSSKNQPVAG